MKLLIQITFLLLMTMLWGQSVHALTAAHVKKIAVEEVTPRTKAKGFETYYGRVVSLDSVKRRGLFGKKKLHKILKQDEIKLKTGETIRSEDVEYALVKKAPQQEALGYDKEAYMKAAAAPFAPRMRAPRDED